MKKWIAKLYFRITGWKLEIPDVETLKGTVMIAAPHTSNWDLPYSLAAFWLMGIQLRYFIKDMYTKIPVIGAIFRWTGAIGVDRSRRGKLTDYAIELLTTQRDLVILVPAEGTRKRVEKWKTGFYTIALESKRPISLGFLDYKNKIAGVKEVYTPTGDKEKDFNHIQGVYENIAGRYPELYNPKIY